MRVQARSSSMGVNGYRAMFLVPACEKHAFPKHRPTTTTAATDGTQLNLW
jgi:hypothetical protein